MNWLATAANFIDKTRALRERRPPQSELNPDHSQYIFHGSSDRDHSQNLITCSLSHIGHILKISLKSVRNFLSYLSYAAFRLYCMNQ